MQNTIHEPNKRAVGLLSFGHMITDSYGGFISPLMPFIAAKLGISIAIASVIMSFTYLSSSILQPVFGYLSDTMSRRFFVLFGITFASLFMCLCGVVNNVYLLALTLFLGNMGVGFFHPQATSLANYFSGNKINTYMGIFSSMGTVGYALGPFVSSYLVGTFGLGSTIFAFAPGLIVALMLYLYLPKLPQAFKSKHKGSFKHTFIEICKNKTMLSLTLISIIKSLVILTFITYMPFLWKGMGYSVITIGTALGLFSATGGVGSLLGGKLADRVGLKNVFVISMLPLIPCGLGTLIFVKTMPMLSLVLFVSAGFFVMLSVAANIVMAQESIPEHKGAVTGIIGGLSWGLIGISLTPLGIIVNHVGIIPVLSAVSFSPIIGILALRYIKKEYFET